MPINGESQQSAGIEADYIQRAVVAGCVGRLLTERTQGRLPYLTKSLTRIDPAG